MGKKSTKRLSNIDNFLGLLLFFAIFVSLYPLAFIWIIVASISFLIYKYVLLFRKNSRNLKVLEDHFFIISRMKHLRSRHQIIFLFITLVTVSFLTSLTHNQWLDFLLNLVNFILILMIFLIPVSRLFRYLVSLLKQIPLNNMNKYWVEDIDTLTGIQFEQVLAQLYRSRGYTALKTNPTADYGADLILKRNNDKIAVQAKCYGEDKKVGVGAINEVLGGAGYHNCNKKVVVTNRYFTENAIISATRNNVLLVNRDGLIQMLNEFNERKYSKPVFTEENG
ncbi:restriction endonuclease [Rossellomorea aquimaris]|uniref:Restriction endonuclease n=1 Tax=Rossellomorea aquimaris TaxID=189382 RepID=A0A5D4TLM9_9BACI|nr:restriction endonuclease [Rossellomorea aquimaris]TYS76597.1 restriction endonuclease [Rossellomorea aquimaris]